LGRSCNAVSFHNVENGILTESESAADFSIRLSFAHQLEHLGRKSIRFDSLASAAPKTTRRFCAAAIPAVQLLHCSAMYILGHALARISTYQRHQSITHISMLASC
jgi:hypothetical protein